MKNFILLSYLAVWLLFIACNNKSEEELLHSSTTSELVYNLNDSSILMYHPIDKNFYLIQSNNLPEINGRMFFSRVGKNFIEVIQNDIVFKYELGKNGVFGFVKFVGLEDKVLIKNSGISKRTQGISISDDFGEKVYCKCREKRVSDNDCTTGGKGATECSQSITDGPLTQSCDTKCDENHYACCWAD